MGKATDFLTPVGRLVQGDCFDPQTKKMDGTPIVDKQGQPSQRYFVGVAFKKTDAAFNTLRAQFDAIARASFPHLFPTPGGPCINPNFSMKIVDGDGFDQNGKPNASKEGFAGHWIMRCSSSYPPKCFAAGKYQPHEQLHVAAGVNPIPRGHYVRVSGSVNDNNSGNTVNAKPGLYVNCNMIEWAAVGDLIISGPDASTVFGGGAPAAGGHVMLNGQNYAALQAAGWSDAQMIQHGHMQAPAAPAPLAPAGSAPPPPPPVPAAPAPVAGKVMLPAAGATTYAQYIQAGWNDAMLVQNGFMTA